MIQVEGTFKESFYFTPCCDFSKPLHLGRQPKTSWVSLPKASTTLVLRNESLHLTSCSHAQTLSLNSRSHLTQAGDCPTVSGPGLAPMSLCLLRCMWLKYNINIGVKPSQIEQGRKRAWSSHGRQSHVSSLSLVKERRCLFVHVFLSDIDITEQRISTQHQNPYASNRNWEAPAL